VPGDGIGFYIAIVAHITTAIMTAVTIEAFGIFPGFWHADAVIIAWHRRKVAGDHQEIGRIIGETDVSEDALFSIVGLDPAKACWIKIMLPEAGCVL